MIAVAGLVLDASEDSLEPDACLVDVGPKLAFCHSTLVSRHSTANCYHSIFFRLWALAFHAKLAPQQEPSKGLARHGRPRSCGV